MQGLLGMKDCSIINASQHNKGLSKQFDLIDIVMHIDIKGNTSTATLLSVQQHQINYNFEVAAFAQKTAFLVFFSVFNPSFRQYTGMCIRTCNPILNFV